MSTFLIRDPCRLDNAQRPPAQEARLITLADLGYGVLDTAMVETAAYVLQKEGSPDA